MSAGRTGGCLRWWQMRWQLWRRRQCWWQALWQPEPALFASDSYELAQLHASSTVRAVVDEARLDPVLCKQILRQCRIGLIQILATGSHAIACEPLAHVVAPSGVVA